MTARDVLAEIEQRADSHALAAGGIETASDPWFSAANWADKPHRLVFDLVGDNRALVAALRAVLDLHGEVDAPWCECLSSHCKCGHIWPCIDLAEVSETITDALNGVTAGGTDR